MRRLFLPLILLCLQLPDLRAAEPLTQEQLVAARKKALARQRRLIVNNDGNEPVYLCKDTTPEELLRYRTSHLVGTHVDSIFYCTWSSGFGLFTHATKVGQVFDTQEAGFSKNMTAKMLAAGTDPLKVIVDFGKKNNIELFWSFRVNDTHDASTAWYGPAMFKANRLKVEHPEWLIGAPNKKPKFGGWTAVDYARPEVRDLAFRYIEEVCQNYDVDGVELDFFRHPVLFKRPAQKGTVCNDEERGMLTDLMRRIRVMTEKEGCKRGRPFLLALRAPDSVNYCRDIGIDLEKWFEQGLVDMFIPSGYFRLNPWSYSIELGHKHGVAVYPSLDESRVGGAAMAMRRRVPSYRARALSAWNAGADGIYLYNYQSTLLVKPGDIPKDSLWHEIGSPKILAGLDQDYFVSVRGVGSVAGGALPHAKYQRVPTLNPKKPIEVTSEKPARVPLEVGVERAEQEIKLRLQFEKAVPDGVAVAINGKTLTGARIDKSWIEFTVEQGVLGRVGNAVEVSLTLGSARLADLHCAVRPRKK